jgi:hypothetical protein
VDPVKPILAIAERERRKRAQKEVANQPLQLSIVLDAEQRICQSGPKTAVTSVLHSRCPTKGS